VYRVIKDKTISARPISMPYQEVEMVVKQSTNPKIQQWNELQPVLRERVGVGMYDSWLIDLELVEIDDIAIDDIAVFKASTRFKAERISIEVGSDICAVLSKIDPKFGSSLYVEYIT
jgi:hypothetical protein